MYGQINSNIKNIIEGYPRMVPGSSVVVRAAATLWGTNVNFSGGGVFYLDGITKIKALQLSGTKADLQIIPYDISNHTASASNSEKVKAGETLSGIFTGYYVITPYIAFSNTSTVSNSTRSSITKAEFE